MKMGIALGGGVGLIAVRHRKRPGRPIQAEGIWT